MLRFDKTTKSAFKYLKHLSSYSFKAKNCHHWYFNSNTVFFSLIYVTAYQQLSHLRVISPVQIFQCHTIANSIKCPEPWMRFKILLWGKGWGRQKLKQQTITSPFEPWKKEKNVHYYILTHSGTKLIVYKVHIMIYPNIDLNNIVHTSQWQQQVKWEGGK